MTSVRVNETDLELTEVLDAGRKADILRNTLQDCHMSAFYA
jgi:hypothetical protein